MSESPATIHVNGQTFARAPRSRAGVPLVPRHGTAGWYKPSRHGVLLMEPDGTPFVFACRNGGGFIVSAHLHNGRTRYMFGLATRDENRLGVTTARASHELARSILQQASVIAS